MKKMLLYILVIVLSISMAVTFSLVGCKREAAPVEEAVPSEEAAPVEEAAKAEEEAAPTEEEAEEEELPLVGLLWDTLHAERRANIANLMRQMSKEQGWEMLFQSANNDEKLQYTQAEAMITKGVKLLLISAVNMYTAAAIVEAAQAEGIKVVVFDRLIYDCKPDIFIGFDNDAIGDQIANYMVDLAPEGNYALICGDSADNNAVVYREGYYRVLQPYIDKGDINIVTDQYCKAWDGSVALKIAEDTLTETNNNVDVFLSQYDGLSNGCIEALREQGLVGKVLVSGQDAELSACQRIVQGEQTMSVWKPDMDMAKLGTYTIVKMLVGEMPETDRIIDNGTAEIPAILLPTIVVDKDNMMDTIIASGARKMEEVYVNVPTEKWPK